MNSILLNLPYYKDIDKSCFSASFFNSVKDGAVDIFRYYIREKDDCSGIERSFEIKIYPGAKKLFNYR